MIESVAKSGRGWDKRILRSLVISSLLNFVLVMFIRLWGAKVKLVMVVTSCKMSLTCSEIVVNS